MSAMKFKFFLLLFFMSALNAAATQENSEITAIDVFFKKVLPNDSDGNPIPFTSLTFIEKRTILSTLQKYKMPESEAALLCFSNKATPLRINFQLHETYNKRIITVLHEMEKLIPGYKKATSDQEAADFLTFFVILNQKADKLVKHPKFNFKDIKQQLDDLRKRFEEASSKKLDSLSISKDTAEEALLRKEINKILERKEDKPESAPLEPSSSPVETPVEKQQAFANIKALTTTASLACLGIYFLALNNEYAAYLEQQKVKKNTQPKNFIDFTFARFFKIDSTLSEAARWSCIGLGALAFYQWNY
jgi:hypothetical protein